MFTLWNRAFHYRQTAWLFASAGMGYLLLLVVTAFHPTAITLGGLIAAAMVAAWLWQFRQGAELAGGNLLDEDIFRRRLNAIHTANRTNTPDWPEVQRLALSCRESASQIAAQEPALFPELTEVLHTVVELLEQIRATSSTTGQTGPQVKRDLVGQSLERRDRLIATHQQLQQLCDQVLLAQLNAVEAEVGLTTQLQTLIELNRTVG